MASGNDRIEYREAGTIGREATARAGRANLTKTAYRVFGGIVSLTALYSKHSDSIALSQLETATGLKRRSIQKGARELHDAFVIVYTPGLGGIEMGGKGKKAHFRLLSDLEALRVQTNCTVTRVQAYAVKGADIDPKAPVKGADSLRLPRSKTFREDTEDRKDGSLGLTADDGAMVEASPPPSSDNPFIPPSRTALDSSGGAAHVTNIIKTCSFCGCSSSRRNTEEEAEEALRLHVAECSSRVTA